MDRKFFICDDSIDGIFTAVYDAWRFGRGPEISIHIRAVENMELFVDYITVETSREKSEKVGRTVLARMGFDAYQSICRAALASEPDKADAVYRTIGVGFALKNGHQILNYLNHPDVCRVFELSRMVANEAHRFLGFVRFRELYNGILFSEIAPKYNILTLICPHFADRLPCEDWMIYDEKRRLAAVHQAKQGWALVVGESLNPDEIRRFSQDEAVFQRLWRGFCRSVCIQERKNLKLQQQFVPLYYQKHMNEMQKDILS